MASDPFHTNAASRIGEEIENFVYETSVFGSALLAAIRGRHLIGGLMFGTLKPWASIALGLLTAAWIELIAQLPYMYAHGAPTFEIQRLLGPADDPPLTAFVLAPFGEEMLFQVGLQTWLQRFGPTAAIVGATVPFFALHIYGGFNPVTQALYMLLPGFLALAIIRQYTKSLAAILTMHATLNVIATCLVYKAG